MADKSPSDLQLNALDINSSLEMAADEEHDSDEIRQFSGERFGILGRVSSS